MISCSEDNDNIVYESKKIEMPQCLNILDEINGNNKHILKYDEEQKEIIFDLYGDPNLFSLRNVKITFYNSALFSFLILMQVKIEGETTFKNITYDIDYKTVTHIKFIKKYNFPIKEPLILPYRLKQNKINKNSIASELVSDICKLEFSIDNNHGQVCELDFCIICQSKTICESCNTDIKGLIKDNNKNSETYGKCICYEDKGFKKMPDKENNMCVCKDNYSFYLNTSQCIQNLELNHNPFYFIDNEFNTNISIYGDCYQTCKKCSKEGSKEEHNCDECKDGYIMFGNFCINPNIDISSYSIKETDNSDTSLNSIHESPIYKKVNDNNVCLYENKEWFKLGKHIFYYAKIDKCIFIYYGIELFFISNKIQCKNIVNNHNYTIVNISQCLNNLNLDNTIKYTNFIDNAKEYNQNSNYITIDKYIEKEKKYFHLYNTHINNKSISSLYFDENINKDLLIFKVDIKRDDTISTQVEYQFYNPIPEKIYEKIDINKYLSKKRRLQNNKNIYLDLPVNLQKEKLDKAIELNKFGIDIFNSSSEFYIDVCNKFKTSNDSDIFLEDRKKDYYPDEQYCEDNCEFVKFNFDTEKVTCKCLPKQNADNFDKVTFKYNNKDAKFKERFLSPNLKVIKCWSIFGKTLYKNFGFYLSLFLFIIFFLLLLYIIFKGEKKVKKDLEDLKTKIDEIKKIKELKESDIKFDNVTIPLTDSVKSSNNKTIQYKSDNNSNNDKNITTNNNKEGNLHEYPKDEKKFKELIKHDIISDIHTKTLTNSDKSSNSNISLISKKIPYENDNNSKNDKNDENNNNEGNLHVRPKDENNNNGQNEDNDQSFNNNNNNKEKDLISNDGNEDNKNKNEVINQKEKGSFK